MATIDVEALLAPISDDAPCGQDIEQEQAFIDLEVAAKGTPERSSGKKTIPAKDPSWPKVADQAVDLLGVSKNLQVAVHLTRAATYLDGLPGAAAGMRLIRGLFEQFWEDVYPLLEEEEDNDPAIRMNALGPLNHPPDFIRDLASAPVVKVKTFGEFSMRSIRLSTGDVPQKDDEEKPDPTHIEAAFKGVELDELSATYETVNDLLEQVSAMHEFLTEKTSLTHAPSFDKLTAEIKAIRSTCAEHLSGRGVAVAGNGNEDDEGQRDKTGQVSGEIRSRQDATQSMDRISEYFRQSEPSSPVPMLMERAKRLVAKDFMEIMEDMAPDGLRQVKTIGGLNDDD